MEIQISNGGGKRQWGLNRENDDNDDDDDGDGNDHAKSVILNYRLT
jgi:hypothetical protein